MAEKLDESGEPQKLTYFRVVRDAGCGYPDPPTVDLCRKAMAVSDLHPPKEHDDKPWHWLADPNGQRIIAEWINSWWVSPGKANIVGSPKHLADFGYRYLWPAECLDPCVRNLATNQSLTARIAELESLIGPEQCKTLDRMHALEAKQEATMADMRSLQAKNTTLEETLRLTERSRAETMAEARRLSDLLIAAEEARIDNLVRPPAKFCREARHLPGFVRYYGDACPTCGPHQADLLKAEEERGREAVVTDSEKAADQMRQDILGGKIDRAGRQVVRKAIDQMDTPREGRDAQNDALGRISGRGGVTSNRWMGLIVLLAVGLGVPSAWAQNTPFEGYNSGTITCSNCFYWPPHPSHHEKTGDANLDRAMAICDEHKHSTGMVIDTNPPQDDTAFNAGYEACSKVQDAWNRSHVAAEARAKAAAEKEDREFLAAYAAKLP